MQNLEVISVNIWHILISLCNLLILFLILKKFLYAPVKKVMAQRRASIDESYSTIFRLRAFLLMMLVMLIWMAGLIF